ncbi:MAG: DUF3885 domain-containing protein [Eubacterium sp.]
MSKIEQLIKSRDFDYLQPYFYNNPYALRCELNNGCVNTENLKMAYKKASEIYNIIFPNGADAVFFDYLLFDFSHNNNGFGNYNDEDIAEIVRDEAERIHFLLTFQNKYKTIVVPDLKKDDCYDTDLVKRNRIICYPCNNQFDYEMLIKRLINIDKFGKEGYETSFVSFENECILSIYDDRGCDIVFADKDKMKELYPRLKPFFLEYDLEEMENRYNS